MFYKSIRCLIIQPCKAVALHTQTGIIHGQMESGGTTAAILPYRRLQCPGDVGAKGWAHVCWHSPGPNANHFNALDGCHAIPDCIPHLRRWERNPELENSIPELEVNPASLLKAFKRLPGLYAPIVLQRFNYDSSLLEVMSHNEIVAAQLKMNASYPNFGRLVMCMVLY